MGYKIGYDITEAAKQINLAAWESSDPRNDGFVAFGVKQDLYRLKWLLDDAIRRCPKFAGEDEWLREQEKQKIIRLLKNE